MDLFQADAVSILITRDSKTWDISQNKSNETSNHRGTVLQNVMDLISDLAPYQVIDIGEEKFDNKYRYNKAV